MPADDTFLQGVARTVRTILVFIAMIWAVAFVDLLLGGYLKSFGILPRTTHGLLGIVFAPFLHRGIGHLVGNTIGLLVFGGLVALRGERVFWLTTLVGALASGLGTWLFGRDAVHIGASGVIFAYFGYLLLAGWFDRRLVSLAMSIIVFVVWWPTLLGILPQPGGISWEGHVFGLVGGAIAARLMARKQNAIATS